MNAVDFVDSIRTLVRDAAVVDAISVVEKPPGRRPGAEMLELSAWFNALAESDRLLVRRLLEIVAHGAVFGLLAVLDGSRTVVPSDGTRGYFELRHVHGANSDVLSGPAGDVLHELL